MSKISLGIRPCESHPVVVSSAIAPFVDGTGGGLLANTMFDMSALCKLGGGLVIGPYWNVGR